jgi:uncharacterized membrane protein
VFDIGLVQQVVLDLTALGRIEDLFLDAGVIDGGAKLPGAPPSTYQDFFYLAVCVGATAQVSDVDITTARYRRLVTQHALVAFFFNTMVLALGINILATIIGK